MRNLIAALALFWRQVRRSTRIDVPDHVPDFPLRCQHCNEAIRVAHARNAARWGLLDRTLYADQNDRHACPGAPGLDHKPMPSVLG